MHLATSAVEGIPPEGVVPQHVAWFVRTPSQWWLGDLTINDEKIVDFIGDRLITAWHRSLLAHQHKLA
jgi:hypothetical protein